ncbi:MAG: DUF4139 domain-containing protein [Opitutaceae bacterium]
MKSTLKSLVLCIFAFALSGPAWGAATPEPQAQPALTVYNGNFAVVRESVPLDLKAGENAITFAGVTVHLEPDSVVLRDPAGEVPFQVLEQSYRADTVSQGLLLSLHEGKEIEFLVRDRDQKEYTVTGRVVRSGYVPGGQTRPGEFVSPLIEVDGKLRFSLPGEPIFPALNDDAILEPTLTWTIAAERAAKLDAELSYITAGMNWQAAYNLIAPEKGDTIDIIGWVTIENHSGKTFDNAVIKLMAGDVSKIQEAQPLMRRDMEYAVAQQIAPPPVTEKAFDEFHLYSIARPTTLRDRETKQVEFIRATGVKAQTLYIYDGAAIDPRRYGGWNTEMIRNDRDYGTQSNPKVWVMREFKNSEENNLGQPLPKGRTRFYRRDDADGRLEFTGENTIDHTPKNEIVRIYTGDAFDVVGERKRTDYVMSGRNDSLDEAFEIKVRNRKDTPVEVRIVEHLYRWFNWEVLEKSHDFIETDAQTIEFRVNVPADGETVVTYRVHYDWR